MALETEMRLGMVLVTLCALLDLIDSHRPPEISREWDEACFARSQLAFLSCHRMGLSLPPGCHTYSLHFPFTVKSGDLPGKSTNSSPLTSTSFNFL